jgi:hypothetical protein
MELWEDIAGYEGFYQVSDAGNVRRIKGVAHYLQPGYNNQGRLQVTLSREGDMRRFQIHRLVLEAFIGPCPEGMECRHLNGKHEDCTLGNLEWNTHTVNMQDKQIHGTERQGENHPHSKLTENDVRAIRAAKGTQREIAAHYGVSQVAIHHIRTRKTWKHVA